MTHLKVELASLNLICWRVWQQVLLASGKANKCASMSPQYAPQPKFEIYAILYLYSLGWEESYASAILQRAEQPFCLCPTVILTTLMKVLSKSLFRLESMTVK